MRCTLFLYTVKSDLSKLLLEYDLQENTLKCRVIQCVTCKLYFLCEIYKQFPSKNCCKVNPSSPFFCFPCHIYISTVLLGDTSEIKLILKLHLSYERAVKMIFKSIDFVISVICS